MGIPSSNGEHARRRNVADRGSRVYIPRHMSTGRLGGSATGSRKRVLCVFGTRPEAIKMALLSKALRAHPDFEAEVCVTAQHRSMLDQVLTIFDVAPRFDLDLMKDNQGLADITSRIVTGMTGVI